MTELQGLLDRAAQEGVAPSLAACVLLRGRRVFSGAAGAARLSTWFDLASLTKPLATGLLALHLVHEGGLQLEAKVARWLPRFARAGKTEVTVEELLEHRSGLPAWRPYFRAVAEADGAIFRGAGTPAGFERARERVAAAVDREPLATPPRSGTVYSDVGFLALGRLLVEAGGAPLAEQARRLFERLGVPAIAFFDLAGAGVPAGLDVAATGTARPREPASGQEAALAGLSRAEVGARPGEVDDDNAYACGGVAGHAGLFGNAEAVAALGQRFLEETAGAGRLASAALALRFATPRRGASRGLAWDRPEPAGAADRTERPLASTPPPAAPASSLGARLGRGPRGAVGHLGFTGCSLWVDLDAEVVVALLGNRTLLGRGNQKLRAFRPRFHDEVARQLGLGG